MLLRQGETALVRACAGIPMLIGLLVLLGWALDIRELKSVLPGAVEMKANTAVCLVLAGLALALLRDRRAVVPGRARVAQALAGVVAAVGVATAIEYLFDWNLGIDEALVHDADAIYTAAKGRMSPFSAAAFTALGIALALLPLPRWRSLARACAVAVGVVGLVSLMGYAWGAPELSTDEWVPPVALHTAVAFLLLGTGAMIAIYRVPQRPGSVRLRLNAVELKVVASFIGALLVLSAVGGWTYRTAAEGSRHSQQLLQVKHFRGNLAVFYADVADAAFAQRTYLITGEASGVERWWGLVRTLAVRREALTQAAQQVGPAQQAHFAVLDQAVMRLIQVLDRGVQLHRQQGAEAARAFVLSNVCTAAMAQVRDALVRMDDFERIEEESREALLRSGRRQTLLITLLALLAAAAVLGAVFLGIRKEMRARSTAERALRRRTTEAIGANRFLESLVQNIPHMIFVKDASDLRFVRLNRAGETLIGLREAQVLGKTDHDFFPPAEAGFFVAKDRQVLARREILDIPEEEIHTADGVRLLHTKKIPLLDEAGRPTHLLGIAEDVTDVREKERQIRSLNEALLLHAQEVERVNGAKSVFLATMSHEIRTPMNGMLGMLELLSLGPLDQKQRQALDVVSESGASLLRIIDDILDFSKIEAGRMELREEVAAVATILQDIRHIHSAAASSKGLVIAATLDPALSAAAWVDPVRLRQVVNNFVSNAVKFTARGRVEIRADVIANGETSQSVRFSVADSGIGIAPEDQQRLFEPFVQVGRGSSRVPGGTGLGLVISRRLVELMGGSVDVASALGSGTTVSFVIAMRTAPADLLPRPRADMTARLRASTARTRPAPGVAQAAAEGTLVLLVDDHPVNRMLLERQLETLGYATESTHDGGQALRQWESGRFGLVFTDCEMPGMDGYELARQIRRREAAGGLRRTPIIACTAMALAGEIEKCREAGMDDCVFKPVELQLLRKTLQQWLPIPDDSAVDRNSLEAAWGSDPARIEAILDAYQRSVHEDRAALVAAVAGRDLAGVVRVAHRMLGASRMVGARGLAASCELLTAASREGDWRHLAGAMEAFEEEFARIQSELQPAGAGAGTG